MIFSFTVFKIFSCGSVCCIKCCDQTNTKYKYKTVYGTITIRQISFHLFIKITYMYTILKRSKYVATKDIVRLDISTIPKIHIRNI